MKLVEVKDHLSGMLKKTEDKPYVGVQARCSYSVWHPSREIDRTTTVWIDCKNEDAINLAEFIEDENPDVNSIVEGIVDGSTNSATLHDAKAMFKKPSRPLFEIQFDDMMTEPDFKEFKAQYSQS